MPQLSIRYASVSTEISDFYPELLAGITSLSYLVINKRRYLIASSLSEDYLKVEFFNIGESSVPQKGKVMDGTSGSIIAAREDIQ